MKKYFSYSSVLFTLGFIFIIKPAITHAQNKISIDNGYFITNPDKLMLTFFVLQKFAPFTISADGNNNELNYKTNSKLNLGVGVTYRGFTVNLSYGFSFLNKDNGQGATKGLDVQFHLFPNKWAIDLLGTFRKGYYLDPKDNNGLRLATFYQRPDVKRDIIGFSFFRVPNSAKFSYKAALTQIDWQTKSAGSLLYGGEFYYGLVEGDSALVPSRANNNFLQAGINKINFFSIGPGVGYAYTLVIDKNYFITGSVVGTLDINYSTEDRASGKYNKFSLLPGGIYKGAIGYNSSSWSISANSTGNLLYAGSKSSAKEYFLPTGNFRFILAKKIGLKQRK